MFHHLMVRAGLLAAILAVLPTTSPAQDAKARLEEANKKFESLDANQDGGLSPEELLRDLPDEQHPVVRRNFKVVDWDNSGKLSREEYLALPGAVPVEVRSTIPDPVADAVETQLEQLRNDWPNWDLNGNGALDKIEFSASQISMTIPGVEVDDFNAWDLDGNGRISRDEALRVVSISGGQVRPDGFILRGPSGVVFWWTLFTYLDANADGFLSRSDLQQRKGLDVVAAEQEIKRLDRDNDQKLSAEESRPLAELDILNHFLSLDSNLNGKLDRAEWFKSMPDWQSNLAAPTFAAFDTDMDEQLSFLEYRWTPMANPLAAWHVSRSDHDGNGTLELDEFRWDDAPGLLWLTLSFFQKYDRNGDGQLDAGEFGFRSSRPAPLLSFVREDLDGDSLLSLDEHLFSLEPIDRAAARCDFALFDFNRDGFWSADEFRANPRHATPADRGPVPDPVVDLARSQQKLLGEKFSAADKDRSGALDEKEFAASQIPQSIFGLGDIPFSTWDLDHNGQFTTEELRRAIDVAYGVSRLDGESLRWDNGIVVNWMWFKVLDRNGDDRLDEQECVQFGFDGEAALERFQQTDLDHDGSITFVEWKQYAVRHPDCIASFQSADTNLDGKLSPQELLSGTADYQKVIVPYLIPPFDLDSDGQLNLHEYRLTPLANFQEAWHLPRFDSNGDGLLSLAEFTWNRELDSRAIAAEFFRKLDVSGDQSLDLDEYFFSTSFRLLEREFARLDGNRDGTLSEAEFSTTGDPAALSVEFLVLDFDGDRRLSLEEYLQSGPVRKDGHKSKDGDRAFRQRDANQDGNLTLEEFLASGTEEQKSRATRDFTVVDWDRNERLSRDEFLTLPGVVPLEQRPRVPDPVQTALSAIINDIKGKWTRWDQNKDGSLDQSEFNSSLMTKGIPGLENSTLAVWDLDKNGRISQEEAVQTMSLAGGVLGTGGLALKTSNGVVFWWTWFTFLDFDSDGFLSSTDLQKRIGIDAAIADRRIGILDRNQDQKLSAEEARPIADLDVVRMFLDMDLNLDGQLDRDEWIKTTPDWRSNIAIPIFQAFDTNGDQHLSFREFRWTPTANPLAGWQQVRSDLDGNGTLELSEFTWGEAPSLRWLSAMFFQRLDRHQDGRLDTGEFCFQTNRPSPLQSFAREDLDGDGRLSLAEHLFAQEAHLRDTAKRDFRLFDLDQDEFWTADEFRSNPRNAAVVDRGPLPDPLIQLVEHRMQDLKAKIAEADADHNGGLDETEFTTSKFGLLIPGLEDLPFAKWDIDADKKLIPDELPGVMRVAYGIARSDGHALRWENGVVVNWMAFKALDRNGDDRLDEEECVKFGFDGPLAQERFQQADVDRDGFISFAEWKQYPLRHLDVIGAFLNADTDLDGNLGSDELMAGTPSYLQGLVRYVFPGFDTDHDGLLNLDEYRLCPLANLQEAWQLPRPDTDNDGLLSLAEFGWNRPVDSRAITAEFFQKFDVSGDGFLDPDEYFYITTYRNPDRDFQRMDKDRDGGLTEAEFVGSDPSKANKRDFAVFDTNHDGKLTYKEYLANPSRVPAEFRIAPGDPIIELAQQQLSEVESKFKAADQDGNGALNVTEFQKGAVARDVAGLQLTRHRDWDCDKNGGISLDEVNKVIHAAFGVRRLDGAPYRQPSGITHNAMLFAHVDADHDDKLSLAEYLERGFGGPAANETFRVADTDKDGSLSYLEWVAGTQWQIDPIEEFLRLDADFDGHLSKDEIAKGTADWMHAITSTYFPGFDDDGDGMLDLAEYRRVPMVNLLAAWQNQGADRDGDGRLSFSEFHSLPGIEVLGLAYEYFRRWDTNKNGKLELSERWFQVDATRVTPEIAFQYRDTDKDGKLTFEEIILDLKAIRKNRDTQERIVRLEEAFQNADADGDRKLTFAEFKMDPTLQTLNPLQPMLNSASTTVSRNAVTEGGVQMLAFIAFNILLVGGAAWYVLFKK